MKEWDISGHEAAEIGRFTVSPKEDAVEEFKRKLKALIRPSEVYVGLNLHLLLDTL